MSYKRRCTECGTVGDFPISWQCDLCGRDSSDFSEDSGIPRQINDFVNPYGVTITLCDTCLKEKIRALPSSR